MMSDYCSACNKSTSGEHEPRCPNNPANWKYITYSHNTSPPQGWICPRCSKVWAPHVDKCDCPRVAGLRPGTIWISKDFDKPLSDEFWVGEAKTCNIGF